MRNKSTFILLVCLHSAVLAKTPKEIFTLASKSIVLIQVEKTVGNKKEITPVGSGVLITNDKVLTNCHVAKAIIDIGPLTAWQTGVGERKGLRTLPYARIKGKDLCLLKTYQVIGQPHQLLGQPARLGAGSKLMVGESVFAIGAPRGLDLSMSDGIVSQLRGDARAPIIQTTAPISPGSSGGGLFDSEGRLVGVTTFYVEGGQNLNFALPVEWLDELRKPASRILNHAGEACEKHLMESARKQATSNAPKSEDEGDAANQCIRLITEQMLSALVDPIESPLPTIAPPATPELMHIFESNSVDVYIKTRTVRRTANGRVHAWSISDFKAPQYQEGGQYYYHSALSLQEYICESRQLGILSLTHYSEPMTRGRVLWSRDLAPREVKQIDAIPKSPSGIMLETACRLANQ